ncbi:MAG: hypothetical protein ACM3P1_13835 [Candidatus Saccharibacteria bacterium]
MKKSILFSLLIVLSLPIWLMAQNPVAFFEEHIDFALDSSSFCINGIYSFYNSSQEMVIQPILFPFAVTTESIDSIKVVDLNRQQLLSYKMMTNAIAFTINILPKDTLDIHIFYRQKASERNTYILTTTESWSRPLDYASYSLNAPSKMNIEAFSYQPDSIKVTGKHRLYKWRKHNFLPKHDFDIIIDK